MLKKDSSFNGNKIKIRELHAMLGLEIALSISGIRVMRDAWSNKMFVRNNDIKSVMSRDRFMEIRSHIQISVSRDSSDNRNFNDPLVKTRGLMGHFLKNSADIAVPTGSMALDENTMRSRARSLAITYNPNKPDKFGVRYYILAGTKYQYIYTFFDNGRGNSTGLSGVGRFCKVFTSLRRNIINHYDNYNGHDITSPSALWTCMVGLFVKTKSINNISSCGNKRYLFCDNFYTCHTLANSIRKFTDSEVCMIGTVRFSYIDSINKINVLKAIESLEKRTG